MARVNLVVDGTRYVDEVPPRLLLVQYLREHLGKVGTVIGCDTGNCGACTVLYAAPDGRAQAVKSCSMLAVQADGGEVTTVEGLAAADGTLHPVQQAFHENHALQCGFCTPGMIVAAVDLLREKPHPTEAEIREVLARLGLEPWDITRTGERVAAELGLADWPRDAEHRDRWIAALAEHPILIQRPIITADDGTAVIGRTEQAVRSVLGR